MSGFKQSLTFPPKKEIKIRCVGKVGFEPNEPRWAADFKSAVSTAAPQPHKKNTPNIYNGHWRCEYNVV